MANLVNSKGVNGMEPSLGKETTDIDIQPAINTVSKLTNNRILPFYEKTKEADLIKAQIPVCYENLTDKKDTVMRRYISDWIKKQVKRVATDTRFEKMAPGTSYYTDEKEYRIIGCLTITWWEKAEEDDWKSKNKD